MRHVLQLPHGPRLDRCTDNKLKGIDIDNIMHFKLQAPTQEGIVLALFVCRSEVFAQSGTTKWMRKIDVKDCNAGRRCIAKSAMVFVPYQN